MIIQSFEQSNLQHLNRITPGPRSPSSSTRGTSTWTAACCTQRRRCGPTTGPSRATRGSSRARTATSPPTRASTRSPSTPTSSRPGSPTSSRRPGTDANGDGDADDVNGRRHGRRARPRDRARRPSLIRRAHKRGLDVHTWTFRNEPRRLASDYDGDPKAEYKLLLRARHRRPVLGLHGHGGRGARGVLRGLSRRRIAGRRPGSLRPVIHLRIVARRDKPTARSSCSSARPRSATSSSCPAPRASRTAT